MTHYLTLIIPLLCLSLLLGCAEDAEFDRAAAENRQAEGWDAYQIGNFPQALLSFERAINLDPTLADAHNGLGWSRLSTSRVSLINPQIIEETQASFEEAVLLDASNADAWIGLANTLFLRRSASSDFQAALRSIANALNGDHSTLFRHDYRSAADLHTLKATCYYYLGESDLARSSIGAALSVNPDSIAAKSLIQLLNSR